MEEANMKFRPYMEDSIYRKNLSIEYCCIDQFGGFSKQGYFGVFDGHGGKEISEYCANRMHEVTQIHTIQVFLKLLKDESWKGPEKCLEEAFSKVIHAQRQPNLQIDGEVKLLDSENSGTTACVAFLTIETKERVFYVANVGDTRAVLVTATGVERLSYDHRANDAAEMDRVK